MSNVRWVCPRCGAGKNAPTRPRKDDVRRYCLACSEETGRLVERSSPTLERKREAAALRSREKRAKKAEKERAVYTPVLKNARGEDVPLNLITETRRALREMGYRKPERIKVTVSRRTDGAYSGRAWPWERRVHYSINRSLEDVLVLVYHEAAHIAAGSDPSDKRHWHGTQFQRTFADALQNRWPFVRYGSLRRQSGYEAGWEVRSQLAEHVKNGGEL